MSRSRRKKDIRSFGNAEAEKITNFSQNEEISNKNVVKTMVPEETGDLLPTTKITSNNPLRHICFPHHFTYLSISTVFPIKNDFFFFWKTLKKLAAFFPLGGGYTRWTRMGGGR